MAATPIPPILDQDRYVRYEPVALTTDFDVPFPYFGTDASELLVLVDGVKVSAFTVVSRSAGGLANAVLPIEDAVVRLPTGVSGVVVEIYGSIRPRRTVQATAAFGTRDFNFVFSYVVAALREMWSQFTRAIQVPPGEAAVILPASADRAGKVLGFGPDGTPRALEPAAGGVVIVGTDNLLDEAVTLPKLAEDVYGVGPGRLLRLDESGDVPAGVNGAGLAGVPAALAGTRGLAIVAGDLVYGSGPATLMRLPKGADGQVLKLAAGLPAWGDLGKAYAAVPTTSGVAVDFLGIPASARRILISFDQVSLAGNSQILIQLGAGAIEATGYWSYGSQLQTQATGAILTTGLVICTSATGYTVTGTIELIHLGGNVWIASGVGASASAHVYVTGGRKALAAAVDRLRICPSNGSDPFDAGQIAVLVE